MKKPIRKVEPGTKAWDKALRRLVGRGETVLDKKTVKKASKIVADVKKDGDEALVAAVAQHDGDNPESVAQLRLDASEPPGRRELPPGFADALERAIEAVESFHRPQVHPGYRQESAGVLLEQRRTPYRRVGVYVPGGRASYPSTVVMTVVPAQLAGVSGVVVATPPATFRSSPALRWTLHRLGVEEIWGMGGAHAVAALAYGTETLERVDKIVGPGNAWVTAAKHLVSGDVGIDGLAGPSEVLILADGTADPGLVAADLLAQAEHDPRAAAILVTDDRVLVQDVAAEITEQLAGLATAEPARASLERFGTAFVVDSLEDGAELADRIAPEHLQLVGHRAEALAERPWAAGAIFVGRSTPEVFGDYIAGPSHVLPTCGAARFQSALGVEDFVRRSHLVRFTPEAARRWGRSAAAFASAEGLPAHAAAARRRMP